MLTRRDMLKRSAQTAAAFAFFTPLAPLLAAPEKRRFKIGACDWSIGQMANPKAFAVAKQIGLDGVQVSLSSGSVVSGDNFSVQALANTDTSGLLAAAGINALPEADGDRFVAAFYLAYHHD